MFKKQYLFVLCASLHPDCISVFSILIQQSVYMSCN